MYTREGERPPRDALEVIRNATPALRARFIVGVYFMNLSSQMGRVGMLHIELGNQARKAIQDEHVIEEAASDTEMNDAEKAFRQAVLDLEQAVIESVRSIVLSGRESQIERRQVF
jgi:CBS domain containing-hemolysin-like protein